MRLTRRQIGGLIVGLSTAPLCAQSGAPSGDGTGPDVGETIPEFNAISQDGQRRTFAGLTGPNGLLLLFYRSADWCPFCKGQLAQLERKREQLEQKGIRIAAISFDTVETLKYFSDRVGIGYPLLSDPQSAIIKKFGVLNTSIAKDHEFYGIPNPVEYLVNSDRTVRAKYFEEAYRDRFTGGQILVTELGGDAGVSRKTIATGHLRANLWASDAVVRGGNRFALGIDLELKPGMHVYAPGVEGYLALDWSMEQGAGVQALAVRYPESRRLEMPAIKEVAPVYEGSFRLLRDVHVGQPKDVAALLDPQNRLTLNGQLRYQACDDKLCYLPQKLELSWTLQFEQHDLTRAPEALRRKP